MRRAGCERPVCQSTQRNHPGFTGISTPYQTTRAPDLEVKTDEESVQESLSKLIKWVEPQLKNLVKINAS
jgi:adenylylsulfate kinase-like enzyme